MRVRALIASVRALIGSERVSAESIDEREEKEEKREKSKWRV